MVSSRSRHSDFIYWSLITAARSTTTTFESVSPTTARLTTLPSHAHPSTVIHFPFDQRYSTCIKIDAHFDGPHGHPASISLSTSSCPSRVQSQHRFPSRFSIFSPYAFNTLSQPESSRGHRYDRWTLASGSTPHPTPFGFLSFVSFVPPLCYRLRLDITRKPPDTPSTNSRNHQSHTRTCYVAPLASCDMGASKILHRVVLRCTIERHLSSSLRPLPRSCLSAVLVRIDRIPLFTSHLPSSSSVTLSSSDQSASLAFTCISIHHCMGLRRLSPESLLIHRSTFRTASSIITCFIKTFIGSRDAAPAAVFLSSQVSPGRKLKLFGSQIFGRRRGQLFRRAITYV